MENEEVLIHHGVLGMKWGVRRDRRKAYVSEAMSKGVSRSEAKKRFYYNEKLSVGSKHNKKGVVYEKLGLKKAAQKEYDKGTREEKLWKKLSSGQKVSKLDRDIKGKRGAELAKKRLEALKSQKKAEKEESEALRREYENAIDDYNADDYYVNDYHKGSAGKKILKVAVAGAAVYGAYKLIKHKKASAFATADTVKKGAEAFSNLKPDSWSVKDAYDVGEQVVASFSTAKTPVNLAVKLLK